MLSSVPWRRNFHQSPVQALLLQELASPTPGTLSLVSASSNGLLVETRLRIEAGGAEELQQSVVYNGGKKNPIFCLLAAHDLVFGGVARSEVKAWRRNKDLVPVDVEMKRHSGWIRAMALRRNLLFTASCNFVKVWQLRGAFEECEEATGTILDVRHVGDLRLFKGDILSLAASKNKLFCGTSDGFLHSWNIPTTEEEMSSKLRFVKAASVKAHAGRITSLLSLPNDGNSLLISASEDGYIRAWSTSTEKESSRLGSNDSSSLGSITISSSVSTSQKLRALAAAGLVYAAGDASVATLPLNLNGLRTVHPLPAKSLASIKTNKTQLLASGGTDGEIQLWME